MRLGRQVLVLPTIGWLALFFAGPLVILLVYSFGQIDLLTLRVHFGWTFENYEKIGDAIYARALWRSILLSATATALCLVIAFPLAHFMARQTRRVQTLLLVAVMIPFWTSFLVRTYAWINILSDNGPLAWIGARLGFGDGSLGVLYTQTSIVIGMVYSYLPLMVLPLYVALERVDRSLGQAAADLGATPRRAFSRVTVPLALPGIVAGCLLVGIPAAGEYVVPAILGGGKTLMFGNVVASAFLEVGNFPFGSALAVAFMCGLTLVVLVIRSRAARVAV